MSKIKAFVKQHKLGILAFFLPMFLAIVVCIGNGIYPIGSNCMLHIDMYHQYCPFFADFAQKLKHGESLLYTWNLGLGSDYISLYAYYLASPWNWLLLLCPQALIIEFMELQILLKIALSGLSAYLLLKYHYRTNGEKAMIAFSTAYALCGFVAAYSWDIMWMDTVALAPLVIMGLEKLVRENKILLYTITLAVSIWSNYYIAIMLCIFLIFYFIWLFFTETNELKSKAISLVRFIIYSTLAGGVSAVLILPEIAVLSYSGSSMGGGFPKTMEWYFNVIAELSRMCVATESYTTGYEHWPNLYCGIFVLVLLVLYGFNRNIALKRKLPAYGMVLFFFISFANNYLDFIWHGFHFPESLPGRQSYLFALLVILMGYGAWRERAAFKTWHVISALVLVLALFGVSICAGGTKITALWSYGITVLFVILYGLLFFLNQRGRLQTVAILVVFGELLSNFAVAGMGMTNRISYTAKDSDYNALIQLSKMREEEAGNQAFYRLEDVERLTKNDSSYHNYSSATIFSSLMNLGISHFYQNVYMEGGKNYYCYNGSTPLTSAMLGVKYIISEDELSTGPYRTLVETSGNLHLYENNYNLSVGYIMPEPVLTEWITNEEVNGTRINNLNDLAALLGCGEKYITKISVESNATGGATFFTIPEDGYYYAAYESNDCDKLNMSSSNGYKRTYSKASHRYLLELGQCEAGEEISITNKDGDLVEFYVYSINHDAFVDAYSSLAKEQLKVTNVSSAKIEGTIITKEGGRMVFSIPSVPGWTLYVDGEEVELTDFCEAFLAVDLEPGAHEIVLKYQTPNLMIGALISALCIIVFLLLLMVRKFMYRNGNQHED